MGHKNCGPKKIGCLSEQPKIHNRMIKRNFKRENNSHRLERESGIKSDPRQTITTHDKP